jgi:large subunit ribosomal protein L4e
MKSPVLDINGKEKGSIDLPSAFSVTIRKDMIAKVLEAKKSEQPFGPSPVAGNQHSASGVLIRRRHVWKSGYGKGASRVPRKVMSNKGSQFNLTGATSPNTVGGRRAHGPKVVSRINILKINKKEMVVALKSALSATANGKEIAKRYARLEGEKIENVPFVVESKFTGMKTKDLISSLKKVLGEKLFSVAIPKKSVRAGQGKKRGRKYKKNAGVLIVIGPKEKIKTNAVEIVSVGSLGVTDLARGGPGRLTIYTEEAIKTLGEKFK